MGIYATCIRPLAFRIEPERAHHLAIDVGGWLSPFAGALRSLMTASDPRLARDIAGVHFPSPIGLAAGFDKSGEAIEGVTRPIFCFSTRSRTNFSANALYLITTTYAPSYLKRRPDLVA